MVNINAFGRRVGQQFPKKSASRANELRRGPADENPACCCPNGYAAASGEILEWKRERLLPDIPWRQITAPGRIALAFASFLELELINDDANGALYTTAGVLFAQASPGAAKPSVDPHRTGFLL